MRQHSTINGPKNCNAATKESCPLRDSEGNPVAHYDNKETAWAAYDKQLQKDYGKLSNPLRKLKVKTPPLSYELKILNETYASLSSKVVAMAPDTTGEMSYDEVKHLFSAMSDSNEDAWDTVKLPKEGEVKVPKLSDKEIEVITLLREHDSYMQTALNMKANVKYHLEQEDDGSTEKDIYEQGYVLGAEAAMKKIEEKLSDPKYRKIDVADVRDRVMLFEKSVVTGRAKNSSEHIFKHDIKTKMLKNSLESELKKSILDDKSFDGYAKEGLRDFASYDLQSKGVPLTTLPDGTIMKGGGILERAAAIYQKSNNG